MAERAAQVAETGLGLQKRTTGAAPATDYRARVWMPPIHRREFWAVQALVLLIAGAHGIVETQRMLPETGPMYFVPASLFFVPVVYAAVNFGLAGSAPTAIWCGLVTLPNLVLWNEGWQQFGELWQIATVVVIGIFVGNRVDREARARREAESRARAHRAAEERYRSLFEHVADAILLVGPDGRVEEANEAAGRLLGGSASALAGTPVATLTGAEPVETAASDGPARVVRLVEGDLPRWVEPVSTELVGADGGLRRQVVLRDVTLRYERQRELEDYTRRTLVAREEERRRIAHDLHDGPVQSLVLLVRTLDRIGMGATPEGTREVARAREVAESVARELRRFSRELRPSILDDLGLPAALKAEADAFAGRAEIRLAVEVSGAPRRLAPDLEVTLLRIEQEALHNVERHAGATSVRVSLAFRAADVCLAVEDDGRGIEALPSPSDLLGAGKMGIVGMQERARLVGAAISIAAGARGGTRVEVVAPG